jgi:hypothetical protein
MMRRLPMRQHDLPAATNLAISELWPRLETDLSWPWLNPARGLPAPTGRLVALSPQNWIVFG